MLRVPGSQVLPSLLGAQVELPPHAGTEKGIEGRRSHSPDHGTSIGTWLCLLARRKKTPCSPHCPCGEASRLGDLAGLLPSAQAAEGDVKNQTDTSLNAPGILSSLKAGAPPNACSSSLCLLAAVFSSPNPQVTVPETGTSQPNSTASGPAVSP